MALYHMVLIANIVVEVKHLGQTVSVTVSLKLFKDMYISMTKNIWKKMSLLSSSATQAWE